MCESPIKELVHSMKPAMTHEVACLLIVKILYYIHINILILKIAFCHYCKLSHSDGMICTQRDKETNTKLKYKTRLYNPQNQKWQYSKSGNLQKCITQTKIIE